MPGDADATRSRILEAAFTEFARYGLAGARVDRIAAAADANKRMLYLYFGSKEQLFETVIERRLAALAAALPFDARDLGGYAGELFDFYLANADLFRLISWAQLERSDATDAEIAVYRPKIEAVAAAQQSGLLDARHSPADVLTLVLALTRASFIASPALRAAERAEPWDAARIAAHRAALITAVERVTRPQP